MRLIEAEVSYQLGASRATEGEHVEIYCQNLFDKLSFLCRAFQYVYWVRRTGC
jgi:hypothetical protein